MTMDSLPIDTMNFKAAALFEQNTPLRIITCARVSLAEGQVEVKLLYSSLCGAQLNEISGVKGSDKYLPHLMGHEGFGIVTKVGSSVTKVKPNDHVILHWRKGSGCECTGPKYTCDSGCVGSGSVTTFSEYSTVAENRVTKIDYNPDLHRYYTLIGCALSTAWGILAKEVAAKKSDKILICGAGGLGTSLAFWAHILGIADVTTYDKYEGKRTTAEALHARFISEESNGPLAMDSETYDVILETTGSVDNISTCFDKLNRNGRLVLVGQPRIQSKLILNNPLRIFDGIKIFSSDGGHFDPDKDIPVIVSHMKDHIKLMEPLVSHEISLDQVNDGFTWMKEGKANRILINFQK